MIAHRFPQLMSVDEWRELERSSHDQVIEDPDRMPVVSIDACLRKLHGIQGEHIEVRNAHLNVFALNAM